MLTIKDLKHYLEQFAEQTPVYFGGGDLPCWITSAEATADDIEDNIFKPEKILVGKEEILEYMYVGSLTHIQRMYDSINDMHSQVYKYRWATFWERLRFLFTGKI